MKTVGVAFLKRADRHLFMKRRAGLRPVRSEELEVPAFADSLPKIGAQLAIGAEEVCGLSNDFCALIAGEELEG